MGEFIPTHPASDDRLQALTKLIDDAERATDLAALKVCIIELGKVLASEIAANIPGDGHFA